MSVVWAIGALTPALSGCGSSSKSTRKFIELPGRATVATLAGPLCEGQACRCRDESGRSAGLPERPGWKRYEITIGPVDNELWVLVDGMVLYKGVEKATACYFIDLPTGKHTVTLAAGNDRGLAARLAISELGTRGSYATFQFGCGGPGPCVLDALDEWQASLSRYKRGVHDPCGSTRIRDIFWQTGKALERMYPTQLQLDFVLDVYDFSPKHAAGDPACADRY